MQTLKFLAIVTLVSLAPTLVAADVVVSHFEPLQQTLISKTDKNEHSFNSKLSTPASVSIRFEALGKSFDLQLVPNDRIASGLQSAGAMSQVQVYRGQLAGNPQSWARIVVFDGMPRGMIWDGVEMYAVEAPDDSTLSINAPVIYRMADAFVVPGTMSCGSDGFIKFTPLGGWWDQVLLTQRVRIKTKKGDIIGVIGAKPPHLIPQDERTKTVIKKICI